MWPLLYGRWDKSFDNRIAAQSACFSSEALERLAVPAVNESGQASRAISTGQLHVLPRFHLQPIELLVLECP